MGAIFVLMQELSWYRVGICARFQ